MLDISPLDLISVLFVMLAVTISFTIMYKSIKSYRETPQVLTLIIAIGTMFIGLAMIFLTMEKAFLSIIKDGNLGILFGGIATTLSACAMTTLDAFAFKMAFTKKAVILTLIAALVAAVYVIFWISDGTKFPNTEIGEIEFGDPYGLGFNFTPVLSYFTLIPLASIPIFVLFYYSAKVRKESAVSSKRAALLGLGGLLLATAYIVELLGLDDTTTTIFRSLFVISSIVFYVALFKIKSKEL